MTHMCYFYQWDVEGIRRQDFSRFVLPLFLFSWVLQIIMNRFFVRISVLAIYQGMEEFISFGVYHSHFTGSMCSHFDCSPLYVFKFLLKSFPFHWMCCAHQCVHTNASSFVTAIQSTKTQQQMFIE